MSNLVDRYDRHAHRYRVHWAPVLAPTALRLLDVVAAWLPDAGVGTTVLDVGAGTGTLSHEIMRRWPRADVVALDPSAGMLAVARASTPAAAGPRTIVAPADAMPLPDASVDLVVSSFALQLVPDRPAALREIHRVLRAGGHLAYVTWLDRDESFAPHEAFDDAVLDLGVEEPDEADEDRAGDLASPAAAAAQMRRAGFRDVSARVNELRHAWTLESFLAYKVGYDDEGLIRSLSRADRARLDRIARRRLAALGIEDFVWSTNVVMVVGARPPLSRRAGTLRSAARTARDPRPRSPAG